MPRAAALVLVCLAASAGGTATRGVRALVESGRLTDLRWPDVSDYRRHLDGFYRGRQDALAWTRDGRPTPQVQVLTPSQ